MNPDKVFLGMPAYGWNWQIYDLPANIGKTYRGTSQTYYPIPTSPLPLTE